ncbi:hypothetical protein VP01_148g16 [Puccinia sorghi]|uniref:SUN domain-containing protein n=1 Tax=Puccinia sorghi TaxID=27349 RepID=A0A0L6VJJ7_9BASI|nr:hypothetical protein VP01_148g16 [Puccinia sorghi]
MWVKNRITTPLQILQHASLSASASAIFSRNNQTTNPYLGYWRNSGQEAGDPMEVHQAKPGCYLGNRCCIPVFKELSDRILTNQSVAQQQSLLNKRLLVMAKQLQDWQEITQNVNQLGNAELDKVMLMMSRFEECILQIENNWKLISDLPQSAHTPLAKEECEAHISFPKRYFTSFSGGASRSEKALFSDNSVTITGSHPVTQVRSQYWIVLALPWNNGNTCDSTHKNCLSPGDHRCASFELWGLDHQRQDGEGTLLLEGSSSIDSPTYVQEFLVLWNTMQHFSQVLVKIKSNHGNPNVTCLYHIQIHGKVGNNDEGYVSDFAMPS